MLNLALGIRRGIMVELKTPCTNEDIEKLKCGDVVKMSGVLYTGRDQAHKRMVAALKE